MVPFSPFYFEVSLLKLTVGKKGTLVMKGLLGSLASVIVLYSFAEGGRATTGQ